MGVSLLDKWARLHSAFSLDYPDRPPILGGWLAAPEHIQTITGCSDDEYWEDPVHWSIEAEKILGSDGMIDIFVPISRGEYRIVDQQVLDERAAYDIDLALKEIESMPSAEELRESFDEEALYAEFMAEHTKIQDQCGDIVWCEADWFMIPKALWYHEFGYETALMTLSLHPEKYRKLLHYSAERGRQRATVRARMIREGVHPKAILTGEDLCSQQGPLVSPEYLREEYWDLLEYSLEPLYDVGAKIVWHCDGNYRPLLDDVLASGIAGLQGFQRECGMELDWIRDLRTRNGDPLLIFGAMSVTETLPFGSSEDVRAEVRRIMDLCRDHCGLVFKTSNTINPDVPLDNIRAYWDEVLNSRW